MPRVLSFTLSSLAFLMLHHFAIANAIANTSTDDFEVSLVLEEKLIQKVSNEADSPEIRYAFFYDSERQRSLFHSIRLYDDHNNLQQTIEGESIRANMFWGDIGSTPQLVDINNDGYIDFIIKVSAGSLGEFSTVWFFDPKTGLYQQVLEELLYPFVEGTNLISSTYTARRDPFVTSISLFDIQPDLTIEESYWESKLIPLKKAGQAYYCLSDPEIQSNGKVEYSLKITLDENSQLTPESIARFEVLNLEEYCYPALSEIAYNFNTENYRSLPLIQLQTWKKEGNKEIIVQNLSVDPKWETVKTNYDNFGEIVTSMECPVIPYINLDHKTIEQKGLIEFETLSDTLIYDDYGYPVICDYGGKAYRL